jgi:hypothetical protein
MSEVIEEFDVLYTRNYFPSLVGSYVILQNAVSDARCVVHSKAVCELSSLLCAKQLDGPVFNSRPGQDIVLFHEKSGPAMGPTQPPTNQ